MEFFDREFLISQILSGELLWGGYTIYPPSLSIIHKSNLVYKKTYEKSVNAGLLFQEELSENCVQKGLIQEEDLIFLENAQKEVENFQRELYINRKSSEEVKKLKKYIELNRTRQSKILDIIQKNNIYTVEGYSNFCKVDYLIRETTFKKNKKCKFKKENINSAISFYIKNTILPSTIRSLSHSLPWSNMWAAFKVNGVVFPQGCQTTVQQQLLLMWSSMYDSIREAYEPPESFVIEDDDMLDGWMILQNSDKKNDKMSKLSQAQEQYILANNIEEAREIENRNSPNAKRIKKQRENALVEKGTIKYSELPDVKMKLMMEKNRLSLERPKR